MAAKDINVALIGLDTSHTIEFARRMQAPDCPPDQKVGGMKAISCLRFDTPFQNKEGLDSRQKLLEEWGVKVTLNFDEAIKGADALMIEINDAAYHLEYFSKAVGLGKRMFLDKPLADNLTNGRKIYDMAKSKNAQVFSSSSLRFVPELLTACQQMPKPVFAHMYGPLGKAPAGSSIVWYGVHTFEMLQRALGRGAKTVYTKKDAAGVTAVVGYDDGRRGVVELPEGAWVYGGDLRDKEKALPFVGNMDRLYSDLLIEVGKFFAGGQAPLTMEDTLEVMAMLDATQRSFDSGREESTQI